MTRTIMTMAEVAEITGVPIDTLWYWRAMGWGGPTSYRLGRRVVYDLDRVNAWVDEQRQASVRGGAA